MRCNRIEPTVLSIADLTLVGDIHEHGHGGHTWGTPSLSAGPRCGHPESPRTQTSSRTDEGESLGTDAKRMRVLVVDLTGHSPHRVHHTDHYLHRIGRVETVQVTA